MKNLLLSLFAILLVGAGAYAQDQTRRADVRQKAQRVRIAEGRQDGEINMREGAVLNKQQRHIRRTERRAKADGTVTVREKRRIERKQDRASRNIRRAKHNDINRDN
ncbi:MAG: hypothetical protein AB7K37_06555 [Cyclobacteriaceae bacterium]